MQYTTKSFIVFLLSVFNIMYWMAGLVIDIYHYRSVGAIYEIIWLPMVLLLFLLTVISGMGWRRSGWSFKSWYFYAFLANLSIPASGIIVSLYYTFLA
jgi:hypothetical protein